MSKRETPMTEEYWKTVGGILIEEYPVVRQGRDQGRRLVDGLIIHGPDTRRAMPSEFPDIAGLDVTVVQTKASRLGMYVLK